MTKILHLPTSVGGMAWQLAYGECKSGLESKVLYSRANYLNYPSDINLHLEKHSAVIKIEKLLKAFFSVRKDYNIFHFNGGSSLLHFPRYGISHLDLPYYPENKKLFMTYNGCDARQKFNTMNRREISACHVENCYNGICNSGKLDEFRKKSILKASRYVNHIWAVNPDLLYFLPREKSSFLPYAIISDDKLINPPDFSKNSLTIVHAPTNRACKGSEHVIRALQKVRASYPQKVKYQLVENISHKKAAKIFYEADLVVDQLLVGWYGGLAIEVMNMGKPVICRIEEDDLKFIPDQMAKDASNAFINANPDSIADVLCRCIEDRGYLGEKAGNGFEYARKWHNPTFVASLTKQKYEK